MQLVAPVATLAVVQPFGLSLSLLKMQLGSVQNLLTPAVLPQKDSGQYTLLQPYSGSIPSPRQRGRTRLAREVNGVTRIENKSNRCTLSGHPHRCVVSEVIWQPLHLVASLHGGKSCKGSRGGRDWQW